MAVPRYATTDTNLSMACDCVERVEAIDRSVGQNVDSIGRYV